MSGRNLFGERAELPHQERETSYNAQRSVPRERVAQQEALVRRVLLANGKLTDHDIARLTGIKPESSARRARVSLYKRGEVVPDGTALSPYGKPATTWRLAGDGDPPGAVHGERRAPAQSSASQSRSQATATDKADLTLGQLLAAMHDLRPPWLPKEKVAQWLWEATADAGGDERAGAQRVVDELEALRRSTKR